MAGDVFFSPCGRDETERETQRETEKEIGSKGWRMRRETNSYKLCTFSLAMPRKLPYYFS